MLKLTKFLIFHPRRSRPFHRLDSISTMYLVHAYGTSSGSYGTRRTLRSGQGSLMLPIRRLWTAEQVLLLDSKTLSALD